MTLTDISTLLNARGILWNKFRGGVVKSAAAVYAEDVATPNHANRLLWAKDILLTGNVDQRAEEMYRIAMTNVAVVGAGDTSLDSDVEWVISTNLNTIATGA